MREAILFPFVAIVVVGSVADIRAADREIPLVDKTLVVWASPANLNQRGGTALTIDANGVDRFDGIVLGELEPKVWMPGKQQGLPFQRNQLRLTLWQHFRGTPPTVLDGPAR